MSERGHFRDFRRGSAGDGKAKSGFVGYPL